MSQQSQETQTIFDFPGAKSSVWSHFGFYKKTTDGDSPTDELDKTYAICRQCHSNVKYIGNTINLQSHISKHHFTYPYKSHTTHTQPKLVDFMKKLPNNSPKAMALTKAVAVHLFSDMRPISTVESSSFREILREAEPKYTLPSRTSFRESILPKMYDDTRAKVKQEITKAMDVSLTTDCWTSNVTQSYMTVTAHLMCNWQLQNFVLRTRELPGSHTSENLYDALMESFNEWGINPICIVSDNASNIVKAVSKFDQTSTHHLPCFAHTLNLVVKAGIAANRQLTVLLTRCRQLVGFFKKRALATNMLHTKQQRMGYPEHKLIQDVDTRWNSTYEMLERILEQTVPG
ncbi:hypothetical protein SNE40_014206 [Patella caerulea]|uniref:BED-type domain-containing protein n=1 Tax=Patella caerulea TaxID=87958 RepID=A0AAN8JJP8_PATCE